MHFWIYIEFTKILGQFKQKDIWWFIHEMLFKFFFFNMVIFFKNKNNLLDKVNLNTLLNKLQDHLFIVAFE